MNSLPGYAIDGLLYESRQSRIYRGVRLQDAMPVIFKVLNDDFPSPQKLARFKQEYNLMRKLNADAILSAYGMEFHQKMQVMVVEDFGGTSLDKHALGSAMTLGEFLRLAERIAACLAQLHRQHVMHKDINPSNIVWNRQTGQVKLIDLGISTELSREIPAIRNPDHLEGTLSYISPEQTGRMNRAMDYRTDFYSLGVTLYELVTGQLPFVSCDALELVHAHIARAPVPVDQVRAGVPPMVASIIAKLMGKTAEERYQSAAGLQADLLRCVDLLSPSGSIVPFQLGQNDFSGRLQISQKLYGRKVQVDTLLHVFDRASRGPAELLLVEGVAGVGKSALVHEIQKPITHNRSFFIEGKFDQFKRDIPYASLSQAFRELIRQLLTKGETDVASWKAKLLQALGSNAQIIIDVIPNLELIIGAQPDVVDLPPAQEQNRFNHEFRKFVGCFAAAEHPLVIFLDDLQWADLPSLQLMSLLMRAPALPHLLLIGAFRDNEITPAHALALTLKEMEKNGALLSSVTLPPLDLEQIGALLCDTLHASADQVRELASLSLAKTHGNPFFLNQFLGTLVERRILFADADGWRWNADSVRRADITDNIVELMVAKLHKLPAATQRVLQGAACLGNEFDLTMLGVICELPQQEAAQHLWPALQEDLVVPLDDHYKYVGQSGGVTDASMVPAYRFLHDRVQQAAYLLSDDAAKAAMHLAIGRLWLTTYSAAEQQGMLFDLANHLNHGRHLMIEPAERVQLAQLNLAAARRAKASVAYRPALVYLETALELVDDAAWHSHYALMFALHVESVEVAYLSSETARMEHFVASALRHATHLLDRVKIHECCIQAYISEGKFEEAVNLGINVLRLLGLSFPARPTRLHILWGMLRVRIALSAGRIDRLDDLPRRTDACAQAAADILSKTGPAAYYAMPNYLPLFMLKGIDLNLRYGYAKTSSFGLASYAMVLIGAMGRIEEGAHMGRLAIKMLEQSGGGTFGCRTLFLVNALVHPWIKPLHETLAPLQQDYLNALALGDLEFAANAVVVKAQYTFYSGHRLPELEKEMGDYCDAVMHMQRSSSPYALKIIWQAALNLMDENDNAALLEGRVCDAEAIAALAQMRHDRILMCYLAGTKLMLGYLFHDYRNALEHAIDAEHFADAPLGFFGVGLFCYYDSLVRLALLKETSGLARYRMLRKIRKNQNRLRHWADHAPANFMHKWHLVEAGLAAYHGETLEAVCNYEQAIRLANEGNFLQEEAMAKELAGEYYLAEGIEATARTLLAEAQDDYRRWGALAKVRDLAERYPRWLNDGDLLQPSHAASGTTVSMTTASSSGTLDFAAVMKASQALSQEIVLAQLLKRLMQVVMESAGAQRSILLLKKDRKWLLEAEKSDGQREATVLQSAALDETNHDIAPLPLSLLHYVSHTGESVVIHEALQEKLVSGDAYVLQHRPRSLLAVPILHHGEMTGLLYLENNAVSGAFTENRLEVLHLLASQAAISIENAQLYADMEERVSARTAELKALSLRDGLTGVANRRAFDERIKDELARSHRTGQPLSLMIIDIDHFKRVNDTYGHPAGDACLKLMGATLARECRRSADFVARYGGEEFALLLSDTDVEQAVQFAEAVREAIGNIVFEIGDIRHPITASIGVAQATGGLLVDAATFIANADRCLYAAKAGGRNQVVGDLLAAGVGA